jgi:hypothetical protein
MNVLHLVKETVIVTAAKKSEVTHGSSSVRNVNAHQRLTDGQVRYHA